MTSPASFFTPSCLSHPASTKLTDAHPCIRPLLAVPSTLLCSPLSSSSPIPRLQSLRHQLTVVFSRKPSPDPLPRWARSFLNSLAPSSPPSSPPWGVRSSSCADFCIISTYYFRGLWTNVLKFYFIKVFFHCSDSSLHHQFQVQQRGAETNRTVSKTYTEDFPGDSVAKTALPMQGTWVRSLVRKLDCMCLN